MTLAGKPASTLYNRDHISEDCPISPFVLTGAKRIFYLFVYALVVSLALLGSLYCLYVNPLFCLISWVLCYLADNFLFTVVHLRLHAQFIELPEKKMNVFEHHAFIHHYKNTKVYHEYWLETRMAYFIDPRSITSNKHMFLYKITLNTVTSAVLYLINPLIGIAYFSGILGTNLIQSTIHEWYHNPKKNRKKFYNPITYAFLSFLEKIKIASSKRHLKHHLHNLHNLDKAEAWLDLYTPAGEWLASKMWQHILTKYRPGQFNMTHYMTRIYEYAILFIQIVLPVLFLISFSLLVGF